MNSGNSNVLSDLTALLHEQKQEVPNFFHDIGRGKRGGGGGGRGRGRGRGGGRGGQRGGRGGYGGGNYGY